MLPPAMVLGLMQQAVASRAKWHAREICGPGGEPRLLRFSSQVAGFDIVIEHFDDEYFTITTRVFYKEDEVHCDMLSVLPVLDWKWRGVVKHVHRATGCYLQAAPRLLGYGWAFI